MVEAIQAIFSQKILFSTSPLSFTPPPLPPPLPHHHHQFQPQNPLQCNGGISGGSRGRNQKTEEKERFRNRKLDDLAVEARAVGEHRRGTDHCALEHFVGL
ncbi:hypothetical protein RHMOL_Rhmol05G0284300 [Rhododendron molle]|uniref:Uncharacterized protein n=1 Tax=Rhododendron molle TaxID=49168 RepID=A0ACC0NUC3_RHOML|nr:hypothetical protein RHMOL_Rhmol05G0284300 [Rhododendron molle]